MRACEPRIAVVPSAARSAGPQVTRITAVAGIQLDEAQELIAAATAGWRPMASGRHSRT